MAKQPWLKIVFVVGAALVLGLIGGCNKYNALVEADATCDQKWADLDAELQRRYDLIPNIVATVKAAAKYEQETLDKVIQARTAATQIKLTADDLTDPAKMEAFQKAQDALKGSLSRLIVTQEAYPDLKASQAFHDLTISLEGTENRILRARQDYNAAVKEFNAELRKVGGAVVNKVTGKPFKPRVYYAASTEATTTVPKVEL